jgi:uncharacterized repeat protein (TIGR01451 family)
MTKQHQKNSLKNLASKSRVVGSMVICLVLVFAVVGYWFYSSKIQSLAASIAFGNGQISLDKKYVSGGNEVDTISSINGTTITVRLKYNNTANESSNAVSITDTIPTGLSYKTGSLKNCYSDAPCATLPDSIVTGSGISVAPLAGFFGYPTTSTQSNLELGRKKYVKLQTDALYSTALTDTTCNLRAENTGYFGTPPFCGATDHYQDIMIADITGNRYLKLQTDDEAGAPNGFADRTCNLRSDNTPLFGVTTFCPDRNAHIESMITDLLGNRYLKLQTDSFSPTLRSERTCNLRVDNDPNFGNPSFCTDRNTRSFAMNADLYDNARGNGYIEYEMNVDLTSSGLLGTNASMSGSFGSITDANLNSIDIINCDVKNPTNWLRSLSLSDAELRTDQDFTCNYQPKICPVVFLDLNNNGIKDAGESNSAGQSIQLLRSDGTTLVTTIVSDGAGNSCFQDLAGGGTEYKIKNTNPLTVYPTTGGNIKSAFVNSSTTTQTIYFGYSAGILSMTAPANVSFQTRNTQTTSQTSCANINPIQVTDSRITNPGWSLSATIDNFNAPTQQVNISIANKLSMNPGTITTISGQNGTQQGIGKIVVSTTDPVSVMYSGSGSGLGVYQIPLNLCLQLDPYTPAGDFQSVITYTLI